MSKRIDHIAIAVQSLTAALEVYSGLLGLPVSSVEEIVEQKTRVALLPIGEIRIELLEPTADDSPVARFLARRGEGIHHICFRVENLAEELERLKSAGMRLIDERPRMGAEGCMIAFIHPSSVSGVLIELSQPGGNHSHAKSE